MCAVQGGLTLIFALREGYTLKLQNDLVAEFLINILKLWKLEMTRMWNESKLICVKATFSKCVERYVSC